MNVQQLVYLIQFNSVNVYTMPCRAEIERESESESETRERDRDRIDIDDPFDTIDDWARQIKVDRRCPETNL